MIAAESTPVPVAQDSLRASRGARSRIRLCSLLVLLLAASAAAQPAEGPGPSRGAPEVPRERFHLYLLLGQSNMAGRGRLSEGDRPTHPRILSLDEEQRWVPARDPLHPDPPERDGEIYGVGPGLSFARVMVERDTQVVIGLIPCAVGGSPINKWRRGRPLFRAALARARAAQRDGVLRGVLWHQGETDAMGERSAKRYRLRLDSVVVAWRDALAMEIPFVAGRLAEPPSTRARLEPVNAAIAGLPERFPRTAVVEVADLETDGPWHFDTESARELGRRYAAAMIPLLDAPARETLPPGGSGP